MAPPKPHERTSFGATISPSPLPLSTHSSFRGNGTPGLVSAAAITGATLIIADEPTPGLHPEVVAETLRHLRELADEGRAVLLITHDIGAALAVADRVAVFYADTHAGGGPRV